MFGPNIRFNWKKIYLLFKNYFDNDLDPLDQVFLADYHGKLMYDFIPTSMKFFHHFNLTGGFPFLHPSVVDISIKIPPSWKYDQRRNIGKIPLRDLISKHDISQLSLEKKGFGMDLRNLWSRTAKDITISTLDNGRIFEDEIINRDFYNRSLKRISETLDTRYISKMLQLLSLEIWYKMFVTSETGPNTSL
jgi:asparagine synthase (glutamine-hydrolysing)